ncbi:Hypothetical predicted protein [Octopus vulgaris]|uniref:Uncharacterized protein n=1 Tax=Octopus vulgaris TaxID=6645 RepID=A0AA36FHH6_OCTVU|nr:Hypothetical predicted protein [Octopus vulgaris]
MKTTYWKAKAAICKLNATTTKIHLYTQISLYSHRRVYIQNSVELLNTREDNERHKYITEEEEKQISKRLPSSSRVSSGHLFAQKNLLEYKRKTEGKNRFMKGRSVVVDCSSHSLNLPSISDVIDDI